MKKTLTVNLAGSVYHIDEDAYVLLDNYLNNLRYHFRKDDGAEEIVRDMEARIAELFTEYIREGKQVITIENVEAVISRMGKPEDLNDNADGKDREDMGGERAARRLFRNPDDRILGGVASGLAAYFGWDVVWVRIVLILAGVWIHGLFLVYLIAWIIIPLARTATEKLQMRGEPINVSNIGKTVTDGFEQENESTGDERPRSRMRRLGDAVVTVVGCLLKLFLILVAICFAPVLLIGLVVLFALLMAATGMLISIPAIFLRGFAVCGLGDDRGFIGNSGCDCRVRTAGGRHSGCGIAAARHAGSRHLEADVADRKGGIGAALARFSSGGDCFSASGPVY